MDENFWDRLQAEHRDWSLKNFGQHSPLQPLAGIVEEIGEYEEAMIKSRGPARRALLIDALCDVVIFASDYASSMRGAGSLHDAVMQGRVLITAYQQLTDDTDTFDGEFLRRALGKLAHATLKSEQKIRTTEDHGAKAFEALSTVLVWVLEHCDELEVDLEQEVGRVWAQVKKRDWTKDKAHAGEAAT